MRVISQNKKNDFPYENGTVFFCEAAGRNIIKIKISGDDAIGVLGEYSTREKAIKAMEMLRGRYKKLEVMKVIASGTAEYMEKSLATNEMIEQYNAYCDMNVFQFPQDDEIEV